MSTKLHNLLFAYTMNKFSDNMEKTFYDRKKKLLSNVKGKVVEIGIGTGANLKYYDEKIEVTCIDPNPYMQKYLNKNSKKGNWKIKFIKGSSENIELPNNYTDYVVSTHVLCAVNDLEKSLLEIKRVLKKNGKFIFLEHVCANTGTKLKKVQDLINPPWKYIALGCNLNRDILSTIRKTGFKKLVFEKYNLDKGSLVKPHIQGYAIK
ncbi:class I SAM-dependent methyltransferase [archaeon]|nr:class I SAM-dependent methyltransferase [archaeon]